MKSSGLGELLKMVNCGHKEWAVRVGDLVFRIAPTNMKTLREIHDCEKVQVFSRSMSLRRIFVIKQLKHDTNHEHEAGTPSPKTRDEGRGAGASAAGEEAGNG